MARAYRARSRIRLLGLDGTVVRQRMKLVKAARPVLASARQSYCIEVWSCH